MTTTTMQQLQTKLDTIRGTGGYAWLHIAQIKQAMLDLADGVDISYKLDKLLGD